MNPRKLRRIKNLSYQQLLALYDLNKKDYPTKDSIIEQLIEQLARAGQINVSE